MQTINGAVMFTKNQLIAAGIWINVLLMAATSHAQSLPWDVFRDLFSPSVCDLVNGDHAEFVVLNTTGEIVLVSGDDIILADTFVDSSGFVFYEGFPFGVIDFATDGDGLRTLWWMTFLGSVIKIDELSGVPSVSDLRPSDFVDNPCDAEPFWDACLDNAGCDDDNACTLDICNGGVCAYSSMIAACDDGNACTAFDACISGECVGSPIADCDITNPPNIFIDFCGAGTTLSMIMTFAGLSLLRLQRRRFV